MKQTFLGLVIGLFCSVPAEVNAHGAGQYRIAGVTSEVPTVALRRTTLSVAVGDAALNGFEVVRVQGRSLRAVAARPLILLSPFGFRSDFWELTPHGYQDSFAARLALAGLDVWLVDHRTADLPPGTCESDSTACAPMADWGIDAGVEDALFVQKLVRFFHPWREPVIGGYSGGSSVAIAAVNRRPQRFAGLFMWEGTIFTADPQIRERNAAFCADDEAALAAGAIVDPTVQGFKALFDLAVAAPDALSPVPGFPPETSNLQALVFALSVPNPASPLNFTEGFIRHIGDPVTATFTYADMNRVLLVGPLIGNYAPVRFLRDSHCAMAGLDMSYADNLDAFRGDVLVYAEGFGFGQMMLDTAALMRGADVTIDFRPELGESDRYHHHAWVEEAVRPLVRWLRRVPGAAL